MQLVKREWYQNKFEIVIHNFLQYVKFLKLSGTNFITIKEKVLALYEDIMKVLEVPQNYLPLLPVGSSKTNTFSSMLRYRGIWKQPFPLC